VAILYVGIDLAKNVFAIHGVDEHGKTVLSWIAAFIGHALRQGHERTPDALFQTADTLFATLKELAPEFVADSTFGRWTEHRSSELRRLPGSEGGPTPSRRLH
jgi:hypothetical protein